MKSIWKEAKAIQARSGWGIKPEENEESTDEVLERKSSFFWLLEEIWGSRPNASIIFNTESIQIASEPASQIASEPVSQIRNLSIVLGGTQIT